MSLEISEEDLKDLYSDGSAPSALTPSDWIHTPTEIVESLQGARENETHNEYTLIHDDSIMLIYGNPRRSTCIYSTHNYEKLLRGLMVRMIPYETDPRIREDNLLYNFKLSADAMQHPPLWELGAPRDYEHIWWVCKQKPDSEGILEEDFEKFNPQEFIETRLSYKPRNMKGEREMLENAAAYGDDSTIWPYKTTFPIPGDTMLKRWGLDTSQWKKADDRIDADLRLGIILYVRIMETAFIDEDGHSRAPKYVLSKIRAMLIYYNEASKCIREEDIEAIFQEVRENRNKDYYKQGVRSQPTNPWDKWVPIITHVRKGHADIAEIGDKEYDRWDYTLAPIKWDKRFGKENFKVRPGCRGWDELMIIRRFVQMSWYNRILRGSPPMWRTETYNKWLDSWKEDHAGFFMNDLMEVEEAKKQMIKKEEARKEAQKEKGEKDMDKVDRIEKEGHNKEKSKKGKGREEEVQDSKEKSKKDVDEITSPDVFNEGMAYGEPGIVPDPPRSKVKYATEPKYKEVPDV